MAKKQTDDSPDFLGLITGRPTPGGRRQRGGPPAFPGFGSSGSDRSPLGVPDDYMAEKTQRYQTGGIRYPTYKGDTVRTMGREDAYSYERAPQYFEGDEWLPANTSPDSIWDMQLALTHSGLMPFGTDFQRGVWDEPTRNAYKDLLSMANAAGLSREQMLAKLEASGGLAERGYFDPDTGEWVPEPGEGGGGGSRAERAPLVYQLPDREEVKQVLRQSIIENLGQGWSDGQISGLADTYIDNIKGMQRDAYDSELTGGSVVNVPSPESFARTQAAEQDPAGVQANDALSFVDDIFQLINAPAWGSGATG